MDVKIVVHLPSGSKLREIQRDIIDIQASMILLKLNNIGISHRDKEKILEDLIKNLWTKIMI